MIRLYNPWATCQTSYPRSVPMPGPEGSLSSPVSDLPRLPPVSHAITEPSVDMDLRDKVRNDACGPMSSSLMSFCPTRIAGIYKRVHQSPEHSDIVYLLGCHRVRWNLLVAGGLHRGMGMAIRA